MKFKCECGKEFDNPQSFNGHKSHCKDHQLVKYGSLEKLDLANKTRSKAGGVTNSKNCQLAKLKKLSQWIAEQHQCEHCGKIMTEKFGSGRFCSKACANSKNHSEETKQKIANSTRQSMLKAWEKHPEAWTTNRHTTKKVCKICGKELAYVNTTGLCVNCLHNTEAGKQQMIASGKQGYATMKANGTHKPWQSRNIISYAERFWMKVLANNDINYQRELVVRHENSNYFLDFYIEINGNKIDLEIDGKQHQYEDRIESDIIRDNYLKSLGYIIYRISWNEISSEAGKLKMQNKISKFLEFYNAL